MSFPYDSTLPNPPDDPADDVGGMQTNASSIASIIAVDHAGFNIATGGTHKQITYTSNNIPSLPTSFPTSFTALPTSFGGAPAYAQQFFYSGTAAQSQNQYVLAGQGSVLLAGGIIMKWGTVAATKTGAPFSFVSAFPNNVFSLTACPINTDNSVTAVLMASPTKSGGTMLSSESNTVYYIAIGN